MNFERRKTAVIAILILSLAASLYGCSTEKSPENRAPEQAVNVPVIVVHPTVAPDWLEAVGTVRPAQSTQVASQMMGNIRDIRVQVGDRVQAGQVLATIDDSQPRAAVDQASAAVAAAEKEVAAANSDLALADSTLKRYQQLFDKKSLSPQEFDEIKARQQSAEARRDVARASQEQANATLAQARTSLGYAIIHAPFSGIVTEKRADPGALASPGMPLFTIEDTRDFRLEVTVDENDIRMVRPGQAARVSLDSITNDDLSGKVVEIVPVADAASRSFLVKIGLPADAHIRSGLFGRARFNTGEHQTLLIPRAAIVEHGQLEGIYVVDTSRTAELRYVTLGKAAGEQIEILSGLQDGETIVAAPGKGELGGKQIASQQ